MSKFDETGKENIYSDDMPKVIAEYLRDENLSETDIMRYWHRAVHYIEDYTGHTREELEDKSVLVQPMLAIIADIHDNRQYQEERSYINELCERMIGLYSHNLI